MVGLFCAVGDLRRQLRVVPRAAKSQRLLPHFAQLSPPAPAESLALPVPACCCSLLAATCIVLCIPTNDLGRMSLSGRRGRRLDLAAGLGRNDNRRAGWRFWATSMDALPPKRTTGPFPRALQVARGRECGRTPNRTGLISRDTTRRQPHPFQLPCYQHKVFRSYLATDSVVRPPFVTQDAEMQAVPMRPPSDSDPHPKAASTIR